MTSSEVPTGQPEWGLSVFYFSDPQPVCYGSMTLKEFADEFCVSLSTVRRWVRNREVKAVKLPGGRQRHRRVIHDDEVEDFRRRYAEHPEVEPIETTLPPVKSYV